MVGRLRIAFVVEVVEKPDEAPGVLVNLRGIDPGSRAGGARRRFRREAAGVGAHRRLDRQRVLAQAVGGRELVQEV